MKADPHPWACDLSQLYAEVWARLTRGVHDRHAPARHPTLATVTPEGRPQARTVVLRAAEKAAGTLDIHTDLRSAKVGDLRVTPLQPSMCGMPRRICNCGWRLTLHF